jgi:hypothetical protein
MHVQYPLDTLRGWTHLTNAEGDIAQLTPGTDTWRSLEAFNLTKPHAFLQGDGVPLRAMRQVVSHSFAKVGTGRDFVKLVHTDPYMVKTCPSGA